MGRPQQTTEGFIKRVRAVHGLIYEYSKVQYTTAHQKVCIACPEHGDFWMTAANHVNGQRCPKCKNQRIAASQRGNTTEFALRASLLHGGKYTYEKVDYKKAYTKVLITCPKHGDFLQAPATHLEGSGCPHCAGRPVIDTVEFIRRAKSIHGDKYDYSKSIYVNAKLLVTITCPEHGDFMQSPYEHAVKGVGCNTCGNDRAGIGRRMTTAQFVDMATKVHGGKYSYEQAKYIKSSQKVEITCAKHGSFMQKPNHHLAGFGCPGCRGIISKPEHEIAAFLRGLGVVVEQSRRDIISPKELDIYLPEHKIAIEYCGLYWHSHKTALEEAKDKHKHWEKFKACEAKGIRLITLYENEWLNRKPVIKRLLRTAVGKLKGRLMARKCVATKPTAQEATAFYDKFHPQGGAGGGVYYGLSWGGKLVACMRFANGINDRGAAGKNKEWTLSRYATRVGVSGGAGRLLKAFQNEYGNPKIKSFSDNRLFSGGMYRSLGFSLEEESPSDYQVWSQKLGLRPKSHYQRRDIPQRLLDHGSTEQYNPETDKRTEQTMTYLMGAGRIYDCGKKRWVLR